MFVRQSLLGKPGGISTQDRLMSTSFRYEINKGKPDHSAIRMQKAAEVNIINKIHITKLIFCLKLEWRIAFETTETTWTVRSLSFLLIILKIWFNYDRNKHEKFKADWVEKSAWSNVAAQQTTVYKQREQELLLLRKAHLMVCIFDIFI